MANPSPDVDHYIAGLPEDRQLAMRAVRELILANLQPGFEEGVQYGMIGYFVPHSIYPAGYHCNPKLPLNFACLGNQKGHMALHLMAIYGDEAMRAKFEAAYAAAGKKLDMGKACLRFKRLDDLALDVIADFISQVSVAGYVAACEATIANSKSRKKPGSSIKNS